MTIAPLDPPRVVNAVVHELSVGSLVERQRGREIDGQSETAPSVVKLQEILLIEQQEASTAQAYK
jgi:hypothetical protein